MLPGIAIWQDNFISDSSFQIISQNHRIEYLIIINIVPETRENHPRTEGRLCFLDNFFIKNHLTNYNKA